MFCLLVGWLFVFLCMFILLSQEIIAVMLKLGIWLTVRIYESEHLTEFHHLNTMFKHE